MRKGFILSVLFTFIGLVLSGQSQVIFTKKITETYIIEHTGGADSDTDAIVHILARGNNTSFYNVEVGFSFKEKRRIMRRGNEQILTVDLSDINFTGDNSYKGFPVNDYLLPELLDFKLKWFKGNQLIATHTFENANLSGSEIEIARVNEADTLGGNNYKIRTSDKLFKYTAENKRNLTNYANQIDDYYEDAQVIENKTDEIESVNSSEEYLKRLQNLNDLYDLRRDAKEALDLIETVESEDYYRQLPLNRIDPAQLNRKMDNLHRSAKSLFDACDRIISNLHVVYLERGMEMLAARRPERADFYFNKSIEIRPDFAPAHFQLARLYYNGGFTDQALVKLYEIRKMTPDYQTKQQADELAQGIYNEFLLEANALNSDGRFDDALGVLSRAREICHTFKDVMCHKNMDAETGRAVNGKYQLILSDIDNALNRKHFDEAEKRINAAIDYYRANQTFFANDNDIADRVNELYFGYIDEGNDKLNKENFEQAENDFLTAGRICRTYNHINCSDHYTEGINKARRGIYNTMLEKADSYYYSRQYHLANSQLDKTKAYREKYKLSKNSREDVLFLKIKQAIYDELVAEGKKFKNAKNYASALNSFDSAKTIEDRYGIKTNRYLNGYISASAKEYIVQILEEGLRYVDINNLPQARKKYSYARELEKKYNLVGNKTLSRKFAELKDRIFAQECINAQNEYDQIYKDALAKSNTRSYIEAENLLGKAIHHAYKYSQCEINTQNAKDKKKEIAPAANYMRQIQEINNDLANGLYQSVIEKYIAAGDYFNKNKVMRFGLNRNDLYTFISSKNSHFINYGITYYLEKRDLEKSYSLLQILEKRAFRKSNTKENQFVMGREFAKRDYAQNPQANFRDNLKRYVKSWFYVYFKRAYRRQWRKMD